MTTYRTHFSMLPERAFQRRPGGNILPQGGGKPQTVQAPDYTQLANASTTAAETGKQLGEEQLAQNQQQYNTTMAATQPVVNAETAAMNNANAQGTTLFNQYESTTAPLQQSVAQQALTGTNRYNTNPGVRAAIEGQVSQAVGDAQSAEASSKAQQERSMESMGVNPNSGKFAAMESGINLTNAANTATAATTARNNGVATDFANQMSAAGLGANLPSQSQGATSTGTSAGNSTVNAASTPAAQYLQGLSAGNGTIMQGQGLNVSGLGTATGAQTSAYNQSQSAAAQAQGGIGSLVGMGLMAGATAYKSDRRLKKKISRVGEDKRGFGIYEFEYRDNPGSRFRGVMADEVEPIVPEAVSYGEDGFAQVDYERLGLKMVEV